MYSTCYRIYDISYLYMYYKLGSINIEVQYFLDLIYYIYNL